MEKIRSRFTETGHLKIVPDVGESYYRLFRRENPSRFSGARRGPPLQRAGRLRVRAARIRRRHHGLEARQRAYRLQVGLHHLRLVQRPLRHRHVENHAPPIVHRRVALAARLEPRASAPARPGRASGSVRLTGPPPPFFPASSSAGFSLITSSARRSARLARLTSARIIENPPPRAWGCRKTSPRSVDSSLIGAVEKPPGSNFELCARF